MSKPEPRIPAIPPAQFTEQQRTLAMPGTGREDLNIVRTFVNHPEVYEAWMGFSERIVFDSSLPLRDREVLTLQTVAAARGEYEIAQHRTVARNIGLSDAEVAAAMGDGSGLPPFEQTLVRAARELVTEQAVSQPTWDALAERYSPRQLMEVVFFVGNYTVLAMATNSFGVEVEQDVDTLWKPHQ